MTFLSVYRAGLKCQFSLSIFLRIQASGFFDKKYLGKQYSDIILVFFIYADRHLKKEQKKRQSF